MRATPRSTRPRRPPFPHPIAGGAFLLALAACAPDGPAELTPETILARDRAAELGLREQWLEARAALEPLVARKDAAAEDLLRAACADLAELNVDAAQPLLRRAAALAPEDPVLLWCRYLVQDHAGDSQGAIATLRRLRTLEPASYTVHLALASELDDLDEPAAEAEAEREYRTLLAIPIEHAGQWRMTPLYRLAQILQRSGREEEAERYFEERKRLEESFSAPKAPAHQPGTLGAIRPHTPGLFEIATPMAAAYPGAGALVRPGCRGVVPVRISWGTTEKDLGVEARTDDEEVFLWRPEPLALVAWGEQGVELLRADASGAWQTERLFAGPCLDVVPIDRMDAGCWPSDEAEKDHQQGDRELDLLLLTAQEGGAALHLLENVAGTWTLREQPLATGLALQESGRILPVDYDHEGDVDLLLLTGGGPRLLRNDGFDSEAGGFTDATAEAGLPAGELTGWVEELDNDSDVDFLFLGGGTLHLSSNDRGGRFSDASASLPRASGVRQVVPADLDGDGWVDLALFGDSTLTIHRRALGGWRSETLAWPLAAQPLGPPLALDWDQDGTTDLVWPAAGVLAAGLLAPGFASGGVPFSVGESPGGGTGAALALADIDGDLDPDLLRVDERGLTEYRTRGLGRGNLIGCFGHKDNARGLGVVIEARSGLLYRRIYHRGDAELVAFGDRPVADVKLTWPNGVVQFFFDLPAGAPILFWQRRGLAGSCPFLYAWNGEEYELVSDVLGITPLGLPMAPGVLVPPDHDEHVLVRGEQLVPRDGFYELQFTEELREVTYLDRIRLDVVDHPAGVEVFPEERFAFPPFPEAHTHTVRDALPPVQALGSDGRDWAAELARDDREYAVPFRPLLDQFMGLTEPYTLEIAFDRRRTEQAPRLRLLLDGWFYWTDASVNMAAARHPEVEFVPPLLAVPDGQGGWKDCGPLGFPAGKLKTMVVDVTELVDRADPRLRLCSTLRLYWDSIRLAVDADDAPLVTTALEPVSARLWERGFSARDPQRTRHGLEWFRFEICEHRPRWNQHPGLYTRLGETVPLVGAIDDRFVILGAGDCLTVRFDAHQAPPLPSGWERDFLVFLDGWAKDRDPNTLAALQVEPLPFHGMSGYPYGPHERYPDDETHRAYRREWNTRPARRWLDSFVPPRFLEPSQATRVIPARSAAAAPSSASEMRSSSTSTPAAPATSG